MCIFLYFQNFSSRMLDIFFCVDKNKQFSISIALTIKNISLIFNQTLMNIETLKINLDYVPEIFSIFFFLIRIFYSNRTFYHWLKSFLSYLLIWLFSLLYIHIFTFISFFISFSIYPFEAFSHLKCFSYYSWRQVDIMADYIYCYDNQKRSLKKKVLILQIWISYPRYRHGQYAKSCGFIVNRIYLFLCKV